MISHVERLQQSIQSINQSTISVFHTSQSGNFFQIVSEQPLIQPSPCKYTQPIASASDTMYIWGLLNVYVLVRCTQKITEATFYSSAPEKVIVTIKYMLGMYYEVRRHAKLFWFKNYSVDFKVSYLIHQDHFWQHSRLQQSSWRLRLAQRSPS